MAAEAAKEYQSSLDELTFNSKLHINVLTMLAEENVRFAENIVQVIERHIQQATADRKLPTLYLMDSIMKNLRNSPYAQLFAQNIVTTFSAVFEKVDEKKRASMYKLRQTWIDIFPNSKLYGIDIRINSIDPAWPITAKPPDSISSIHVNPKFLTPQQEKEKNAHASAEEARRLQAIEEENLRRELEEEERKRQYEEEQKKKKKEEDRKRWEEDQERKMRDELLAKQQELMKLQQQRLELELEETRRALLEKEKMLKEKEKFEQEKKKKLDDDRRRREDQARIREEMALRRNLELEIRRKTLEDAKRKAEFEKLKKESQSEVNSSKVSRDPRSRLKPLGKSHDSEAKNKKKTSPDSKTIKADIDKKGNTSQENITIAKKTMHSASVARPEHFCSDRVNPRENNHRSHESKEERPLSHRSDKDKYFARKSSSPRSDRHRRDLREDTDRSRGDKKPEEVSRIRRESSDNIRSSRDSEESEQKHYNRKAGNVSNKGNSNRSSKSRDHLTKPHRTYRSQRHSKSPSSEEEETELNIQPRRLTPEPPRAQRRSRGSNTPDRLIPRKSAREELTEKAEDQFPETPDEGKPKRTVDMKTPDEEFNKDVPPSKKSKNESEKEDASKSAISSELKDLFGSEDIDYRKMAAQSVQVPMPHLEEKIDFNSPQQKGWAKFKENRPEEFPFQQPRRLSVDVNFRPPHGHPLSNQGPSSPVYTPKIDTTVIFNSADIDKILQQAEAQLLRGRMSYPQFRELQKQLSELQRIQSLMADYKTQQQTVDYNHGERPNMFSPIHTAVGPMEPPPKPKILQDAESEIQPRRTLLSTPSTKPINIIPEMEQAEPKRKALLGSPPSSARFDKTEERPALLDTPERPPLLEKPREMMHSPGQSVGPFSDDFHNERFPERDSFRKSDSFQPNVSPGSNINHGKVLKEIPKSGYKISCRKAPFERKSITREEHHHNVPSIFDLNVETPDKFAQPKVNNIYREKLNKFYEGESMESNNEHEFVQNPIESDNNGPFLNSDEVYIPEYDPRWMKRKKYYRETKAFNMYELVINGSKIYQVRVGGPARLVQFSEYNRMRVSLDANSLELFINDICYTRVGEPERVVVLNGEKYSIWVRGMPQKFWIDEHPFELLLDAPPELVTIASKPFKLQLIGVDMKVVLNEEILCPIDLKKVQDVIIEGNKHKIQFFPPLRRIILNKKPCELNLASKYPTLLVDGVEHGVRFSGPPRTMVINNCEYEVPMDRPVLHKIDGKGKYLAIAFGGPGHEVIIDEYWYEVPFNGPPVTIKTGFKTCTIQLPGSPPEVNILGRIENPGKYDEPELGFHSGGRGQHMMRGRGRGGRPLRGRHDAPFLSIEPPPRMFEPRFCRPFGRGRSHGGPHNFAPRHEMVHQEQQEYEEPSTSMPKQQVAPLPLAVPQPDIGNLFDKLVSAGIINKKCVENQPSDVKSETPEETPVAEEKQKSRSVTPVEELEEVPDLTDLTQLHLKKKYQSVVNQLYKGVQCSSCGTRFKDIKSEKYKEHLDWHFRQNKREKEDSRVVRNRRWYYSVSEWVQFEEVGDLEERIVSNIFENMLASIHQVIGSSEVSTLETGAESCPIASTNEEENVCVICSDQFEQFYDDDEEEWHLRDAVRVDGKTYHPVCYEDAKEDMNSSLLETANPTPAPLPDPIANPLAYLSALSEQAKQTNQSMDMVAKQAKTEATATKQTNEPVLEAMFKMINVPSPGATAKTPPNEDQQEDVKKDVEEKTVSRDPRLQVKTETVAMAIVAGVKSEPSEDEREIPEKSSEDISQVKTENT